MNIPEKPSANAQNRAHLKEFVALSLEFGFMIALPLLLFGYLGKWLDARQGTGYYIYIGITLALTSSFIWFYKKIKNLLPPK